MENRDTEKFEIHELLDMLKQSTSMIWTAFGVFFTVNTLLATGYGFLLGYVSDIPKNFATSMQMIISVCGVFIAFCAYSTIKLITNVQRNIFERGTKLDQEIGTQIFKMIPFQGVGYPWGTVVGSFIFGVFWAVGGGHALSSFLTPG